MAPSKIDTSYEAKPPSPPRTFAKPIPFVKPIPLGEVLEQQHQPKSPSKLRHQMAAAPEKKGITFAHQDSLKKLPIPELEDTCRNYLAAVKPLQTRREHAETRAAVSKFLKTEGPEMHEKLKKYADNKSSYIEQFCMFIASKRVEGVGLTFGS